MIRLLAVLLFTWQSLVAPIGAPPFEPEFYYRERWTLPMNTELGDGGFVGINLFKDAFYLGVVTAHEDGMYWRGYLRNQPNSYFVVSCYKPTGDCWLMARSDSFCYMAYGWEDYFRIVQFKDLEQCQ